MAVAGKKCRVARHHAKKGKAAKKAKSPKARLKVKVRKAKIKAGMKPKVHREKKSKAKVRVAKKGACGTPAAKPDAQTFTNL